MSKRQVRKGRQVALPTDIEPKDMCMAVHNNEATMFANAPRPVKQPLCRILKVVECLRCSLVVFTIQHVQVPLSYVRLPASDYTASP